MSVGDYRNQTKINNFKPAKWSAFFMKQIIEGQFFPDRFPGKEGWTLIKNSDFNFTLPESFWTVESLWNYRRVGLGRKASDVHGKGGLFMPISKPIRQEIVKEEGDKVIFKLYRDEISTSIPRS